MKKNPFQCKKQQETTIEKVIQGVLAEECEESTDKNTEDLDKTEEVSAVNETDVLKALQTHKKEQKILSEIPLNYIYNYTQVVSADEEIKNRLEETVKNLLYYQVPESHMFKKESSSVYNSIFVSWRQGLTELFSEYRRANTQGSKFSFYVYSDKLVYYFHTNKYNGCDKPCCHKAGYSLYISAKNMKTTDILERFESNFVQSGDEFYLSGKEVLFILDTILNTQVSTIQSLPLVLSKYPFVNSILKKPTYTVRSENRSGKKAFRIIIKGWIITTDIAFVNLSTQIEMKHIDLMK
ncbi:hypothetical protein NEAUS05_1694 [Nematocida ausubeli]|nr:hypothetical protein NEAUS07_1606 [Nematocida ausubeli]KAI5149246.1 hypothetical protein NEAUS05_1694 [Nematocida ausubeli]